MQSIASVPTASAARYLGQLCKHWSHKFEVEFDALSGRIVLPLGVCRLTAGPGVLGIVLETADETGLARMEQVVADHLNRFAHREGELVYDWSRTA